MKNILIVDDDMMSLTLAKHTLSKAYNVTGVTSGKEALESLQNSLPDLILLDIEMPEMNGWEVAKAVKSHGKWKEIPLVFLTGDADPETEASCLTLGADDFIVKPFVPIVMTRRIARIMELNDLKKTTERQLEQKEKQIEYVTQISMRDSLTELYNRSYLEKKITELIQEGHKGTLFIMDLDNFKQVNDTYGHIAGDKTLKLLADTFRENTRKMDVIGRLGGDEFVIFFLDMTDRDIATQKANAIKEIFSKKFRKEYDLDGVSVSGGIAQYPESGKNFNTLYKNADKALYYMKNNGKNGFYFYNGKKENISENDDVVADFNNVRNLIEGKLDTSRGAFQVAYGEFQKIYDFVLRCVVRKQQKVQTVLLTLSAKEGETCEVDDIERAMIVLQSAVKDSLRAVDVGTGYSSRQYILILMDADIENGKRVVERVLDNFDRMNEQENVVLTYDIQTMHPELK